MKIVSTIEEVRAQVKDFRSVLCRPWATCMRDI